MVEDIKKMTKILKRNQLVDFAYLFGSRARGSAGKRSDWDITVFFGKGRAILSGWTVFQIEGEISTAIGNEVQIIALNRINGPVFTFQIINDDLILIDKRPNKWILYELDILRLYHDWHFFLKKHMTFKEKNKGDVIANRSEAVS